jgi:hypothetical protein
MDLKLSHLTHLNILPSLTACLVLSTWSGHGLVVSPHTGHKGAKLTALSPAAMDDEATCADASDAGEVVWGMRSGQVRYSGPLSTANPFRGDFQIIGRNPAMITAVAFLPASSALARTGAADVPLAAAASADGSICVYDSRTADTVWVLDESARLLDQDGILLRISHLCATSCSVCIGSQRGTVCSIAFNQQMTSLDAESSSAVLHLEALSDTADRSRWGRFDETSRRRLAELKVSTSDRMRRPRFRWPNQGTHGIWLLPLFGTLKGQIYDRRKCIDTVHYAIHALPTTTPATLVLEEADAKEKKNDWTGRWRYSEKRCELRRVVLTDNILMQQHSHGSTRREGTQWRRPWRRLPGELRRCSRGSSHQGGRR